MKKKYPWYTNLLRWLLFYKVRLTPKDISKGRCTDCDGYKEKGLQCGYQFPCPCKMNECLKYRKW